MIAANKRNQDGPTVTGTTACRESRQQAIVATCEWLFECGSPIIAAAATFKADRRRRQASGQFVPLLID
jgi:hypothetical protein